jgi:hypothetical protein
VSSIQKLKLGFGSCGLMLRATESGHSGEFVEVDVAGDILDDDVVIGISSGLGFVRLNVAFQREWMVKSKGEGYEVGEEKNEEWSMMPGDGGGQPKADRRDIAIILRARTKRIATA